MLDTFQLGHEQTKVEQQFSVLLFTLKILINPQSTNEERSLCCLNHQE